MTETKRKQYAFIVEGELWEGILEDLMALFPTKSKNAIGKHILEQFWMDNKDQIEKAHQRLNKAKSDNLYTKQYLSSYYGEIANMGLISAPGVCI